MATGYGFTPYGQNYGDPVLIIGDRTPASLNRVAVLSFSLGNTHDPEGNVVFDASRVEQQLSVFDASRVEQQLSVWDDSRVEQQLSVWDDTPRLPQGE